MVIPPYLKKGDKIGIAAPAKWIEQAKYKSIINIFESRGFEVVRGATTYLTHGPFAGTDDERLHDLQSMLNDPELKALFCLRGGYGTIRIIEGLGFEQFAEKPKWVIGFSDITILHSKLNQLGFASIHGQMPLNFVNRGANRGLDKLFDALAGEGLHYDMPRHPLNRRGTAEAELVGGNIAILSSLIGTPYDLDTDGKILFVEEVGEYLYRLDRLMHHLKLSGKLSKIRGLVVGGLSNMKDNTPPFGLLPEDIIAGLVEEYDYPVCFGFPAGHIKENFPLVLGRPVMLDVGGHGACLSINQS